MNTQAGSWTSMKKKVFQRQLSLCQRTPAVAWTEENSRDRVRILGSSSCRYSGKLASVGYTIGAWWLTQQFVVCYNQPAPLNPFLSLSRQTIYLSKNIFYGQHYVKTTFCVNESTYEQLINSAGRGNSDRPD